jgi:hypothetical protein
MLKIQNQGFWFNNSFVERFNRSYLSSLEKWALFLPKVSLFLQFVLLFKIEKNMKIFIVRVNHFCLRKMTTMLTRNMKKQMNEALQRASGDALLDG